MRGLWGAVADRVAAVVLTLARSTKRPSGPAWAAATALLDALSERAPVAITRPTPFPVRASGGGETWFTTKGTCCLYYRTVEAPALCGQRYCSTCPLADPDQRQRMLAAGLDEQAASSPSASSG